MAFPEAWMNELMDRNDIVSVASEYTRLTPRGNRMWGFCPFHAERNASFTVSPDKQVFHCFSCKAGGSVIQLVMQAESLSYVDAVRFLAQRAHMDMPDEINDAKLLRDKALRDRLYAATREAAKFYYSMLMSDAGQNARRYLISRGIDGSTANRFGLGFSPDDWSVLYEHLSGLGFTRDELIGAGLCVKGRRDENDTFDFFHGRLMFPVISASGRVIAFGGRVLDSKNGAKYMNTGDTLIYNKRHNIYGINLMKGRKLGDIIMVEGYMDVISLHQAGIDNAVASLGTALTVQQARLLKRFAPRVYYAYDGDDAGQKAMLRGIDILAEADLEARVIIIPDGRDPDEFVRAYGSEAFMKLKDSALTGTGFKLDVMTRSNDLASPEGRESYAREACRLLSSLEPVERDRYIRHVCERSGLDIATIREQCGVSADRNGTERHEFPISGNNTFKKPKAQSERDKAEQMLLACMFVLSGSISEITSLEGFSPDLFTGDMAAFVSSLIEKSSGASVDLRHMLSELEGSAAEGPAAAAAISDEIENPVETARDCIRRIRNIEIESRILLLAQEASETTDAERRGRLLAEQMRLMLESRKQ